MNGLQRAESVLKEGGYTCVLVCGDKVLTSNESGVAPLIKFIESGKNFTGCFAADKIVGKAAALLYAHMGVKAVFAEVLSASAKRVFEDLGIKFSFGTLTEGIINRRGDGPCPMELAVSEISAPVDAFKAVKETALKLAKAHA